jgi:hypothetical protein
VRPNTGEQEGEIRGEQEGPDPGSLRSDLEAQLKLDLCSKTPPLGLGQRTPKSTFGPPLRRVEPS